MKRWLFKTEPSEYSLNDLAAEPLGFARWDGIRNYQARNLMRDHITNGDQVFIYHSACKQTGVVGVAKVVSEAYADPAQFDSHSAYYDAKADVESPRWFALDVAFVEKFDRVVLLSEIKQTAALAEMVLLKQGRLSIQPVTDAQWQVVMALAGD